MKPTVSVLMPVKIDAEQQWEWYTLSWESIVYQEITELILINDASKIDKWVTKGVGMLGYPMDPTHRIRWNLIDHSPSTGLSDCLNFGLKHCTSDLIIRMDADDIARPDLIQRQVKYMIDNPECAIVGCQIQTFGEDVFQSHHPVIVTREMAYNNIGHWFVNHPGVCYRREVVMKLGGYPPDNNMFGLEDYRLWIKILLAGYEIHNQDFIGVDYRRSPGAGQHSQEWHNAIELERLKLAP